MYVRTMYEFHSLFTSFGIKYPYKKVEPDILMPGFLLVKIKFLLELINSSACINELLLARKERMAL